MMDSIKRIVYNKANVNLFLKTNSYVIDSKILCKKTIIICPNSNYMRLLFLDEPCPVMNRYTYFNTSMPPVLGYYLIIFQN